MRMLSETKQSLDGPVPALAVTRRYVFMLVRAVTVAIVVATEIFSASVRVEVTQRSKDTEKEKPTIVSESNSSPTSEDGKTNNPVEW